MRELIEARLTELIQRSEGIPRYFDCDDDEYIWTADELADLEDEELLACFEATIGFQG